MKVDHLVADVDGTGVCILDHLQTEAAIKGQHLLGVLHGKGHVIEAPDSRSLLRRHPRSAGQSSCGGDAADESSTRNAIFHRAPLQEIVDLKAAGCLISS
jgi:hypothetical protein